jgi:hypothetical protein
MVLRSLIYAIAVFVLTGFIALVVAGIIMLLYKTVRRSEAKKELTQVEAKPASPEQQSLGKEPRP